MNEETRLASLKKKKTKSQGHQTYSSSSCHYTTAGSKYYASSTLEVACKNELFFCP